QSVHVLPARPLRIHRDRRGADARQLLLQPEGQRARARGGARRDGRGRDLRWPALPAEAVVVHRRARRPLSEGTPVSVESLTALAVGLLTAAGVPTRAAGLVADGLVAADIEDQASHGVALLTMYLDRLAGGSVSPTAEGCIVSDTGSAIVIDAE